MLNVYTFALFFILICVFCENEHNILRLKIVSNQFIFFILTVYLMLLAGFRYGIETDYWSYKSIFNEAIRKGTVEGIEKGFLGLILLYKKVFNSNSFNGFVFILAFISVGLKIEYISKLKEPFVALLFYFLGFYLMFEFNVIRQGTAICFLLFASEAIVNKKFKNFLLFVLIAFLFHSSSILFLPMYFICSKRITITKIFFFIFIAMVLSFFSISIATFILGILPLPVSFHAFLSRLLFYLKIAQSGKFLTLGLIRRIVVIILLLFICGREGINLTYFKIFFFGCLLYIFFIRSNVIANRLSGSFEIFIVPLLGCGERKKSYIATLCFAVLIVLYVLLFFVQLKNGNALPYQTYFMESSK